mgnify:CR=1 FL=1
MCASVDLHQAALDGQHAAAIHGLRGRALVGQADAGVVFTGLGATAEHLDEMVVKIGGQRMFMWRAVAKEGEVLDLLVQKRRSKKAALKLLRKLLNSQGQAKRFASTHSAFYNTFNIQRHLVSRKTMRKYRNRAFAEWQAATAAAA